jgi:hypothetical protein
MYVRSGGHVGAQTQALIILFKFMFLVATAIDCSKSASQDQHQIKQEGIF